MLSSLENLLRPQGVWPPLINKDSTMYPDGSDTFSFQITLNQPHPLYTHFLTHPSLASVPRERFSKPFVRFYRSDVLLTQEELDTVMESIGITGSSLYPSILPFSSNLDQTQ
jgi:hypothetical protein